MIQDVRFALRTLRRSPGFTLVVMATLGLGIGINTAIFSLVNGVLLRPLPYDEPERVMTVWEANPQLDIPQARVAAGTYRDWTERSESFAALGAYSFETFILGGTAEPEQISGARVSPSVFDVVGVQPALGRSFREEEATPGNDFVVILSNGFWTQRFGADPGVIGTAIVLDDEPFTIVGVMPPRFEFPPDADAVRLWRPLAINAQLLDVRAMRVYNVVGRLESGVSVDQARSEMAAISLGIAEEYPETNRGWGSNVTPALEQVVGDFTTLVAVLAGAAALVLLIACVNIANLVLARASVSQREFAIRATLGAGRGRLLRRSLAESSTLAILGGGFGLLLAVLGVALLKRVLPPDVPRIGEIGIDATVLGFAAAASVFAGIFFGLYPAIRAMRPRLVEVLQDAGRGGSASRFTRRLLNGMVSGQVALALILLLSAGVMIRSFSRLLQVEPGFRTEDVMVAVLSLPSSEFRDRDSQVQFWNELVDRVSALPGVEAAGASSALPMSPLGAEFDLPISILGREAASSAERPRAQYRSVLPGYFETMGVPLIHGRLLDRFDREEGRPVMVLNESAERLLFPGEDPIGRILGVPMAGEIEIIGVVGDVRHNGLDAPPSPELFVAYQNFPLRDMHLVVHSEGDEAELAQAIRAEIAALAPALPVTRVATMEELVSDSLAQPRFNMALLLSFALCALVLATVGIYGVISYSVVQRTGEIGIRMALGSDAPRTFRLVVGQTLAYVLVGGVLGVVGSFFASQLIRGLLYEVSPLDPLTLVGVAVMLVATAAGAAAIPAQRATRIDPISALRPE
ncbi:MAG: ABC transporter permease [Gemmatimonadetes bacterium]|nr:ABC transporter permease [Gemmatimonadota bacterium]